MSWFQRRSPATQGVTLTVSDAARQYIFEVLVRRNIPQDIAARLKIVAGSLDITMGPAQPGDTTVSHRGRMILLLDTQTAQSLAGHTIDLQRAAGGPQLVLRSGDAPWSP